MKKLSIFICAVLLMAVPAFAGTVNGTIHTSSSMPTISFYSGQAGANSAACLVNYGPEAFYSGHPCFAQMAGYVAGTTVTNGNGSYSLFVPDGYYSFVVCDASHCASSMVNVPSVTINYDFYFR